MDRNRSLSRCVYGSVSLSMDRSLRFHLRSVFLRPFSVLCVAVPVLCELLSEPEMEKFSAELSASVCPFLYNSKSII